MNFLRFNKVRNKLYELRSFQIFIFSLLICVTFYFIEGLIGIDRFYHPDSKHYLSNYLDYDLESYVKNPQILFSNLYYQITNLLNDNYYLLILLNFIIYSLTNVLIYQKVFKRYFGILSNLKLMFLFYLLFLDPYRLHLTSHILKETLIIYVVIVIVVSNIKLIKVLFVFILESLRTNSWIYILVILTYSNVKLFFKSNNFFGKSKLICLVLFLLVLISLTIFFVLDLFNFDFIQSEFVKIINKMKMYYNKEMPIRSFDHVVQFRDLGFPIGFILKTISWPILLLSGFFIFFVSSMLFKILGVIIAINNLLIFTITKKTFISFGLVVILLMISVYTTSYTSMFRYSYVAIYSSIVYFFLDLDLKKLKFIY